MAFRYPACRVLKRESGAVGAFVELSELAVREFKSQQAASGEDVDTFIRSASAKHGMYLHYKEWPATLARLARGYVMQINECLERFLAQYAREHSRFFTTPWRSKRDDESRIDYVLDCAKARTLRTSFKYKLIKYYVDVRHATVHPPNAEQLADLDRDWLRLAEHREEIAKWFPSQGQPNAFEKIAFNDHKLFVRAGVEFAFELALRTRPSDTVLGELAAREMFRKRDNSTTRYLNRTARYLHTEFGLENNEADAIARYHVSGPLAQR
jgi:hypothetical protein